MPSRMRLKTGIDTSIVLGEDSVHRFAQSDGKCDEKFRLVRLYHNEEYVGEGIRQSGVPRSEIFVS